MFYQRAKSIIVSLRARLLKSSKDSSREKVILDEQMEGSPAEPPIEYSDDLTGISEQSLDYWRGIASYEFTSHLDSDEWNALDKTYRIYKSRGFDEPHAWGRAIEDMADRYAEGFVKFKKEQDRKNPVSFTEIKTPRRPTLYRSQVEGIEWKIRNRIEELNKNNLLLLRVTRAFVLGSYLDEGRRRLPDIDIAIELEPRDPKHLPVWENVKDNIDKIKLAVRSYSHEELNENEKCWLAAKNDCISFLKELNEYFDVADVSWVETHKHPCRTIYP